MPRFSEQEKVRIRQLLQAEGEKFFCAYGLKKVSIDELAQAAGIAKATFYRVYESKEALFLDIAQLQQKQIFDALDQLLLWKLRTASAEQLARLPDCTEGLENRLKACADQASSREELLALLKTRRYAHARLSRLCTHQLLDMNAALLAQNEHPSYVRLLGLRRESNQLTALFKQSALPVIAKASAGNENDPLFQLDLQAYELWALGAKQPSGLLFRQGMAVV